MAYGFVGAHRMKTVERKHVPVPLLLLPVERRLPAAAVHAVPSGRQPELRPTVAAVLDEGEILAVAHRPRCERERLEPDLVARPFVVKGEGGAVVADLDQPALAGAPLDRRGRRRHRRRRIGVGRTQRIAGQHVLGVHQDQFLMLLLVMQPEFDQRRDRRIVPGEKIRHRRGDVVPIGHHLGHARPRDEAALRPRMPRSNGLVIGVEEIFERRIERPVSRRVRAQQEGLEEPGRVREMPLGRARIRHRLHGLVFRRERFRELFGEGADGEEAVDLRRRVCRRGLRYRVRHMLASLRSPKGNKCRFVKSTHGALNTSRTSRVRTTF